MGTTFRVYQGKDLRGGAAHFKYSENFETGMKRLEALGSCHDLPRI